MAINLAIVVAANHSLSALLSGVDCRRVMRIMTGPRKNRIAHCIGLGPPCDASLTQNTSVRFHGSTDKVLCRSRKCRASMSCPRPSRRVYFIVLHRNTSMRNKKLKRVSFEPFADRMTNERELHMSGRVKMPIQFNDPPRVSTMGLHLTASGLLGSEVSME